MKRVIIESPYAGYVDRNLAYARCCLLDSLKRGEAPIASHLLYTQVLDDTIPEEREQGINAGLEWRLVARGAVFYIDFGYSSGMEAALKVYDYEKIPYVTRILPAEVLAQINAAFPPFPGLEIGGR